MYLSDRLPKQNYYNKEEIDEKSTSEKRPQNKKKMTDLKLPSIQNFK